MATLPQWIEARVIQKIATVAEWNEITLVPYKGEVCLVGDSGGKVVNIKIGDGINTFPNLDYMFDSIQQNVGYIAIESNALPTPLDDVAWGMVTGGTYTFGGVDVFTVPAGHWGIANYSSEAWSLMDMGELPMSPTADSVEEGNNLPVQSNAVYSAIRTVNGRIDQIYGWATLNFPSELNTVGFTSQDESVNNPSWITLTKQLNALNVSKINPSVNVAYLNLDLVIDNSISIEYTVNSFVSGTAYSLGIGDNTNKGVHWGGNSGNFFYTSPFTNVAIDSVGQYDVGDKVKQILRTEDDVQYIDCYKNDTFIKSVQLPIVLNGNLSICFRGVFTATIDSISSRIGDPEFASTASVDDLSLAVINDRGRIQSIENRIGYDFNYGPESFTSGFYNLATPGIGGTAPDTPISHLSWYCKIIQVLKGDVVKVKCVGGNNGRGWAITNLNRTILTMSDANVDTTENPFETVIQEDGFLYVNTSTDRLAESEIVLVRDKLSEFDFRISELEGNEDATAGLSLYGYINNRLPKDPSTYKVLLVGNSFSQDVSEHLPGMLNAAGITNVTIGRLVVGGSTLEENWNWYKNNDAVYAYTKATTGTWANQGTVSLKTALADEDWDVIVVQQQSGLSGLWNTFNPFLGDLIQGIRMNSKIDAVIAFHSTWAYATGSTHSQFPNYDNDQIKMFNAIMECGKRVMAENGIDIIIPSGAAIQNVRNTDFNTPNDLTRDGYHLDLGIGRYVAACAFWESIIAPVLGVSIVGNTFRTAAGTAVTSENAPDLQLMAKYASINRLSLSLLNNS